MPTKTNLYPMLGPHLLPKASGLVRLSRPLKAKNGCVQSQVGNVTTNITRASLPSANAVVPRISRPAPFIGVYMGNTKPATNAIGSKSSVHMPTTARDALLSGERPIMLCVLSHQVVGSTVIIGLKLSLRQWLPRLR